MTAVAPAKGDPRARAGVDAGDRYQPPNPSGSTDAELTGGNRVTVLRSLLTAQAIAAMLGVPNLWVYEQSRLRRIPTVTLGRYRRYRPEVIARTDRGARAPPSRGSGRRSSDVSPDDLVSDLAHIVVPLDKPAPGGFEVAVNRRIQPALLSRRYRRKHSGCGKLDLARFVTEGPEVDSLTAGTSVACKQLGAPLRWSDADLIAQDLWIAPQQRGKDFTQHSVRVT